MEKETKEREQAKKKRNDSKGGALTKEKEKRKNSIQ